MLKKGTKSYDGDGLEIYTSLTLVLVHSKIKFTLEQATKAQRGSTGIALLFL